MTATANTQGALKKPATRKPLWELALRTAVLAVSVSRRNREPAAEHAGNAATATDDNDNAEQEGRGRGASTPSEIPVRGWKDIAWRVYAEIGNDRLLAVAAGVTFYTLLAVFPAIASFVSIYGLVADRAEVGSHVATLSNLLPGGAVDIISEQVNRITGQDQTALGFAFIFSLGLSLWSANAGVKAMIDALNVAYGETEKRGFFVLNAVSLCFTLGAIVFLIVAMGSVVVLPIVLGYVGLGSVAEVLIRLARWPVLFAVLVGVLAVLFRYGPSRRRARWRWVTWGSAAAAALWLIVSILFSWYVSSFGSYNVTYGSLGAVVGMMTWIWLSVTVVLIGAEINAEAEHQTAKDSTVGGEKPLGARGATMADKVGPAQVK